MSAIKLNFCDMYDGFAIDDSVLARYVLEAFDCEISDNPDYLIVGPYGHKHLKYNCIKILYTGENNVPDFNIFDYAIGFDHMNFGDRYLRLPLFAIRSAFVDFRKERAPSVDVLLNREFCSYVVSNGAGDPIRTKFYNELSKYKKIASGGRYMNNVGGPVANKMDFISRYKFSITFENSASPGYTTEKIMEPMSAWSVPIYWGNPLIEKDFHPESFVRVRSESDISDAVDRIIDLDRNDDAYIKMCLKDPLIEGDGEWHRQRLIRFFANIFEQPIESARRIIPYGQQEAHYRKIYRRAMSYYDLVEGGLDIARLIKRGIMFWR